MMTDRIGRLLLAERRKIRPRLSAQNGNIWIRVCGRRYYEGPENLPNCLFKSDGPSAVRWFHSIGNISSPLVIPSSAFVQVLYKCLHFRSWKLDRGWTCGFLHPATIDQKKSWEKREREFEENEDIFTTGPIFQMKHGSSCILCVWSYIGERERPTH